MKRIISISIFAVILLSLNIPAMAEKTPSSPDDAKQSVVRVLTEYDIYCSQKPLNIDTISLWDLDKIGVQYSTGSAFAVGNRKEQVEYFVTNRHVVEDVVELPCFDGKGFLYGKRKQIYILMDDENNDDHIAGVVTLNNNGADLAILKLRTPTDKRFPATLRPFESIGSEDVYSLGFPAISDYLVSDDVALLSSEKNVIAGKGIIRHVVDRSLSDCGELIETDVTMTSGNSGGPLVDKNGNVVGVCTARISLDFDTTNTAVSVNEVIRLLRNNDIPYLMTSDAASHNLILYVIIAAAIVAVTVAIVVVLKKHKRKENSVLNNVQTPVNVKFASRILVCVEGGLKEQRFPLKAGGSLTIGTDPSKCNVVISGSVAGVSRNHCTISFDGREAKITDNGSSYGTFLKEKKLSPNLSEILHRGEAILIGSKNNIFTLQ